MVAFFLFIIHVDYLVLHLYDHVARLARAVKHSDCIAAEV